MQRHGGMVLMKKLISLSRLSKKGKKGALVISHVTHGATSEQLLAESTIPSKKSMKNNSPTVLMESNIKNGRW